MGVSDDQLPAVSGNENPTLSHLPLTAGSWSSDTPIIPTHSHPAIPTPIPNKLA